MSRRGRRDRPAAVLTYLPRMDYHKTMKRTVVLVFLAVLALSSIGCFETGSDVTFDNRSTYSVAIWPNVQTWQAFALAPGEKKTIKIEFEYVSFFYDPIDFIFADFLDAKTIIFRDRPLSALSGK